MTEVPCAAAEMAELDTVFTAWVTGAVTRPANCRTGAVRWYTRSAAQLCIFLWMALVTRERPVRRPTNEAPARMATTSPEMMLIPFRP